MKFTGKERDPESDLDYFVARYYGNALGRFITPDGAFADQHPPDPQSWNLYSYVRNNPLAYLDPTGKSLTLTSQNPQDKADFKAAIEYLSKDPGEKDIIKGLQDSATDYKVEIVHDGNDQFDPATNTISWDPRSSLATESDNGKLDGGTQSPALGLGHELDHGFGQDQGTTENGNDQQYGDKEEKRVIVKSETPASETLKEGSRVNHKGVPYESKGPQSTVPTDKGVKDLRDAEAQRQQKRRLFHTFNHGKHHNNHKKK